MKPHLRPNSPIVLHICAGLDFGGVETHLRTIAVTPNKQFEHIFCAIMCGGAEEAAIIKSGSRAYVLGLDPWRRPLRCLRLLVQLMRKLRPQIVHCHGLEGNLFGLLAAGYCRIPVRIGEEIGIPDRSAKMRFVMSVVYRLAGRVIGVSDAVQQWLITSGEVPAAKAVRLYNPVTMSSQSAQPRRSEEPLRIAFLGRLDPVKNLSALIAAVALLPRDSNIEVWIIGDGPERSTLEELVERCELGAKIHLHGFSTDPEAELLKCHLYVQPSLAEGFGIAVVEAMSCGLPAIVSGQGGMAEIVEHGRTGWVLDTPDPENIAASIMNAFRLDPQDLANMGKLARQSVRERFESGRYVAGLERLYDDMLSADSGRAGARSSVA